jgi:thiamine biosynthesis lipoprotein
MNPYPRARDHATSVPRLRSLLGPLALVLVLAVAAPAHAQQPAPQAGPAPAARPGPDQLFVRGASSMGTRVTVSLWTQNETEAVRAAALVFDEFRRIDELMTTWRESSDVSRINAAAGGPPVVVAREVITVIQRAQQVARTTGGAFDITVGAYRGLWKFDQDKDGTIPDPAAVAARLPLVGYRDVRVNLARNTVQLRRKGMSITLGGIAKGYAVDRAVKLLHQHGFKDFLLQAGGDLYISGRRGDRPWRVGVRDPRGDASTPFALVELEDRTFSTSGDYERSVIADGVRYHHILDPATGRPAMRCRSVTVMTRDAFTADAWSTALFVLGPARGMALVEKHPELEAVFVDAGNQVHVSSGLEGRLRVLHLPSAGI